MSAEPESVPSLRVMREAATRYIDAKGLRAFGRAIGMSPWGAAQMVKGESEPRATTLRRLRSWYLLECGTNDIGGGAADAALIGIKVLVHDLPRARRRSAALRVHGVLREESGKRAPRWVSALKKTIETEWPA